MITYPCILNEHSSSGSKTAAFHTDSKYVHIALKSITAIETRYHKSKAPPTTLTQSDPSIRSALCQKKGVFHIRLTCLLMLLSEIITEEPQPALRVHVVILCDVPWFWGYTITAPGTRVLKMFCGKSTQYPVHTNLGSITSQIANSLAFCETPNRNNHLIVLKFRDIFGYTSKSEWYRVSIVAEIIIDATCHRVPANSSHLPWFDSFLMSRTYCRS